MNLVIEYHQGKTGVFRLFSGKSERARGVIMQTCNAGEELLIVKNIYSSNPIDIANATNAFQAYSATTGKTVVLNN